MVIGKETYEYKNYLGATWLPHINTDTRKDTRTN